VEVSTGASGVKGAKKTLGGLNVEAVDDHWEFWDIIDSVATSLDEGCTSRSSESGRNGVSVLVNVGLSVPSSPDLERGEHATLAAHVAEGTLTGSVSA